MTLTEIIPHIVAGHNVRRNAWRHDERYLFMKINPMTGNEMTVNVMGDVVSIYSIPGGDFWADDWEILP